ncbi:hypothetical protein GCM10010124_24850 [Pilimelia terevasa]|uniref:TerB N-terminal domain-containing protein n=1 Tax=Pilimelia terevasa TaxID=53372 RepID=A0A8J3BRD4_9ACTN|nr:TerB N-terminal domain-containing protein [Pilimelia terevasa]GGK31050.1 hypothetical protein GCM10010124_24850 [Pilimelia terevasa]
MTTTTAHPPREPATSADAAWLPAGAAPVTVRGYRLRGGLLYLGSGLAAAYRPVAEPALVDPALPVRRVRLDQETPAGDAAPAYADLTAGARAAYLEWLADDRSGPTAPAHLWLYLAGLERRVLHDLAGDPDGLADYQAIGAEVARLRREYGHLATFDAQAAAFEATVDGLAALADPHLHPPMMLGRLSPRLVAGLGRYLAAGQPLPAPWAYAWAVAAGHEAAGRDDFVARFEAVHPDGLAVPPPPRPLALTYRPVNPGFDDRTVTLRTPVPDVRSLEVPLVDLLGAAASTGPVRPPRLAGPAAAVNALLRLIVLAGADDELLELVSRHLYDLHALPAQVRGHVDDALTRFVAAAPDIGEVRARYATLDTDEQDAVARLLIATTSIEAVVEPEHAQLLAAAYDVLGPGEGYLCRRLRALEVAAVVDADSERADATATVLDEAMVAAALRDAAPQLTLLEDLLTP